MTQDIKEAMREWQRERALQKKIKKQELQLTELQKTVAELTEKLVTPPSEEVPPEETPPTDPAQPLEIETDLTEKTAKSGLSKFWDNLKAPGREGREYRKEKRNARRQNPSQKPPPENPQ